jgi:thioredoxin 1
MIKQLTDNDYKEIITKTPSGMCIFFKELCPHCKNMEKVMDKFSTLQPGVALLGLNIQQAVAAAKELGVERAPTILVIKNGTVVNQKSGLMNPKEMLAFYQSR